MKVTESVLQSSFQKKTATPATLLLSLVLVFISFGGNMTPSYAGQQKDITVKFKEESCFHVEYHLPYITFSGLTENSELIHASHLGQAFLTWQITVEVQATGALNFQNGHFQVSHANKKDGIIGRYTDFTMDAEGNYTLLWSFESGSGRFANAFGSGRTLGKADLSTACAEFKFSGQVQY